MSDRYREAVRIIRKTPFCAGESLLQRRMKVSYADASILLARMERDGYIAAQCGDGECKYRDVLAWRE